MQFFKVFRTHFSWFYHRTFIQFSPVSLCPTLFLTSDSISFTTSLLLDSPRINPLIDFDTLTAILLHKLHTHITHFELLGKIRLREIGFEEWVLVKKKMLFETWEFENIHVTCSCEQGFFFISQTTIEQEEEDKWFSKLVERLKNRNEMKTGNVKREHEEWRRETERERDHSMKKSLQVLHATKQHL